MDSPRYKSTIGFIDLLFNILLGFAFLFIIAFLLIKPEAKKEDFERRAEFVIVMEWNHEMPDDIDLYVQDPTGDIVSFRHPIVNFMHLDKDDLGYVNDIVYNANGKITKVNINREVVTIRGIIPGEYIINIHMYFKVGQEPVPVTIQIDKINPYSVVLRETIELKNKGDEVTVARFSVKSNGDVINVNKLPKKLVERWDKG